MSVEPSFIVEPTYEVRPARTEDVSGIDELLQYHFKQGKILPRSRDELYERLRDFFVVEGVEGIAACSALEVFTRDLGEVRSLAVDPAYEGKGLGRALVERVAAEARRIGLRRLMALTYVPGFFHKLGFTTVPKATLPEKVWGVCVKCHNFYHCDEIAVLRYLDESQSSTS